VSVRERRHHFVELNDARVSLMQTEWALAQAKYGVIVAGARTKFAAGL
jgi:outer membrane protein TolC